MTFDRYGRGGIVSAENGDARKQAAAWLEIAHLYSHPSASDEQRQRLALLLSDTFERGIQEGMLRAFDVEKKDREAFRRDLVTMLIEGYKTIAGEGDSR